jgi:hypothetical protein
MLNEYNSENMDNMDECTKDVWIPGKWKRNSCAYNSGLLAAYMNPVHGDYRKPRLWETEVDGLQELVGLAYRYPKLRIVHEIKNVPDTSKITSEKRIEVAIHCLVESGLYRDSFIVWALNWLDGSDQSMEELRIMRDEEILAAGGYDIPPGGRRTTPTENIISAAMFLSVKNQAAETIKLLEADRAYEKAACRTATIATREIVEQARERGIYISLDTLIQELCY